jgi:hypothetical protein
MQKRGRGDYQGKIGPKEQNPAEHTLTPVALCLAFGVYGSMRCTSKGLGNPDSMVFLAEAHMTTLLGLLHLLPTAFLSRQKVLLESLTS